MAPSARPRCQLRCSRNSSRCRRAWCHSTRWRTMALNITNRQSRSGTAESSRKKAGLGFCPASISTIDDPWGNKGLRPGGAGGGGRQSSGGMPDLDLLGRGSSMPRYARLLLLTFSGCLLSIDDAIWERGTYTIEAAISYDLTFTLFLFVLVRSSRVLMISRRYGLASWGLPTVA